MANLTIKRNTLKDKSNNKDNSLNIVKQIDTIDCWQYCTSLLCVQANEVRAKKAITA